MTDHTMYPFFLVFEVITENLEPSDPRARYIDNGSMEIQGGIENMKDVTDLQDQIAESIEGEVSVLILSWRPFLSGKVEFKVSGQYDAAQETTSTETVTTVYEDTPAYGSPYGYSRPY